MASIILTTSSTPCLSYLTQVPSLSPTSVYIMCSTCIGTDESIVCDPWRDSTRLVPGSDVHSAIYNINI